jgi:cytoskeletal protein RodZ
MYGVSILIGYGIVIWTSLIKWILHKFSVNTNKDNSSDSVSDQNYYEPLETEMVVIK